MSQTQVTQTEVESPAQRTLTEWKLVDNIQRRFNPMTGEREEDYSNHWIKDHEGKNVALMCDYKVNIEKNTALIVAAPDLLRALQAMHNEVRGTLRAHEMAIRYDSGNSNWACLEMAITMAASAIAKAEGRS